MKVLLDTHIWIWHCEGSRRLPPKIVRFLTRSSTELWLSPVSLWETLTLIQKGRLRLSREPAAWIEIARQNVPSIEAPLTNEVVQEWRAIHLPHNDPIDHLLAATARAYDLTFVTVDEAILKGKGFRTFEF